MLAGALQQSASSLAGIAEFDIGEGSGGQSVALFAGRLYNRRDLLPLTDVPRTLSDAELIAELYAVRGEQLLSDVRGIFAVVIWDARQRILLAARDPLGIYPLFYLQIGNRLLFSTSAEQLAGHQDVRATLNRAALADHLCHRWPLREETFFTNVKRLPPGHVMRIQGGWRRIYRYWDPAPPGEPVSWVSGDVPEQFDELLNQAVERCLQLGPAGVFLSAGLDSASVAAAVESTRRREEPAPWALSLGHDRLQTPPSRFLAECVPSAREPFARRGAMIRL